ncbi:MAG TPA: isoaspartyl peptidase/L-asparaginase, partial [Bacteroidales bacterium]|nr:isoaspartyl peptidase/L-asparaginase [Bacteroidales bacterium]
SCSDEKHPGIQYALIIHGGAGNSLTPENVLPAARDSLTAKLNEAIDKGLQILSKGGSSVDAVEAVIVVLEDSPLFNAGKGSVFTHDSTNEMDASIMNGQNLNAGAVAGVMDIKNPIKAARKVMEDSPFVFLSGEGASAFAGSEGLELVDPYYFYTERSFRRLQKSLEEEKSEADTTAPEKFGTVGCVALDVNGNLCAGTSTGGMTNKRYGRIGDSPVIGAGTYANNTTCGVSSTGHGEYFIRYCVAHDISSMMAYMHLQVKEAAKRVIQDKLKPAGGEGGVICLDKTGNYAVEFNTRGMLRAYGNSNGERFVKIFARTDDQ